MWHFLSIHFICPVSPFVSEAVFPLPRPRGSSFLPLKVTLARHLTAYKYDAMEAGGWWEEEKEQSVEVERERERERERGRSIKLR